VDRAQHLAVGIAADAVRELGEPLAELRPEFETGTGRQRKGDAAEAGDVLMPNLAIDAAGLDDTELQPPADVAETQA
jgi:hypothetical protein